MEDLTPDEAKGLLKPRGEMDATEIRACLVLLSWSQRQLAEVLQVDEGTVRKWARNRQPLPAALAPWLRRLAKVHADNPPPPRPAFLIRPIRAGEAPDQSCATVAPMKEGAD